MTAAVVIIAAVWLGLMPAYILGHKAGERYAYRHVNRRIGTIIAHNPDQEKTLA